MGSHWDGVMGSWTRDGARKPLISPTSLPFISEAGIDREAVVALCAPPSHTRSFYLFISPKYFPQICVLFLLVGFLFTCTFIIYQIRHTKFERKLRKEIVLATIAAFALAWGFLFGLLWTGTYF
eukprot:GHVT01028947.1.p1 GENE.GHVT01028947.1~~GHVT01028947.1.p1  ORF type:complete len:124 (+),score=19.21 GHVT01028947.1:1717-2088(+)